jgi:replicative DNA helicase
LEQSRAELGERILCAAAGVNSDHVRKRVITPEQAEKLRDAKYRLRGWPVFIDDAAGQSYLRIAATARRLKMRYGVKAVFVDYLQLVDPEDRRAPRHEQVAAISRRLKLLAKDLQVCVVCLAQLNRNAEDRPGHVPRLSDLRESGSVEQDADVVLLLHRPDYYDSDVRSGQVDVIVAKQRNGPTGVVTLFFRKENMRFESFTPMTPQ